jgi:ribonuclease T1
MQTFDRWLMVWLVALFAATGGAFARTPDAAGLAGSIAYGELPREAQETVVLIRRGGPFPYRKDGVSFENRERRLPSQARGYYKEYTVPSPWAHDRGARRVIAGKGSTGDVATGGEYYYTDDHYKTFRRIRE